MVHTVPLISSPSKVIVLPILSGDAIVKTKTIIYTARYYALRECGFASFPGGLGGAHERDGRLGGLGGGGWAPCAALLCRRIAPTAVKQQPSRRRPWAEVVKKQHRSALQQ